MATTKQVAALRNHTLYYIEGGVSVPWHYRKCVSRTDNDSIPEKEEIIRVIDSGINKLVKSEYYTEYYIEDEIENQNEGLEIDTESLQNANEDLEEQNKQIEELLALKQEVTNTNNTDSLKNLVNKNQQKLHELVYQKIDNLLEKLSMEEQYIQEDYALASQDPDPTSFNQSIEESETKIDKMLDGIHNLNEFKKYLDVHR